MFVPPRPIGFTIFLAQLGKIRVLPMVFFHPDAISLVFMRIPGVIVVVSFVMVGAVVREQRARGNHSRHHERGSQNGRIPKTGSKYSHACAQCNSRTNTATNRMQRGCVNGSNRSNRKDPAHLAGISPVLPVMFSKYAFPIAMR